MSSKLFFAFLAICSVSFAVEISTDVNDVKFIYYPSSGGAGQELVYENVASVASVVSGAGTILLIDGFLSNSSSPMSQNTKNSALLRGSSQQNVIVVDWGRLSGSGLSLDNLISTGLAYAKVLNNVGPVGGRVADFVQFLKTQKNIQSESVHIIGHSLGAHIAGAAGVFLQQRYGGSKIGRISGLDPAGPFFSLQMDKDKRLHKGDARWVDIYHTNRGTLGDSDHQTGDINVYINGGDNQPGCAEADANGFKGYCSHSYSWKFYDATYHRDVRACPCSGLPCQCNTNCNDVCSNSILVGANAPFSSAGAYHVVSTDPLN